MGASRFLVCVPIAGGVVAIDKASSTPPMATFTFLNRICIACGASIFLRDNGRLQRQGCGGCSGPRCVAQERRTNGGGPLRRRRRGREDRHRRRSVVAGPLWQRRRQWTGPGGNGAGEGLRGYRTGSRATDELFNGEPAATASRGSTLRRDRWLGAKQAVRKGAMRSCLR
jgi:ribosomal protein S27AE